MNNERFFKKSDNYGTLTEVLTLWFKNRPELENIKSIKKYIPTIVQDVNLTETTLNGLTMYTPEQVTNEVLANVEMLIHGKHPFCIKAQEIYDKYNTNLDNAIDYCTDEEYTELLQSINFKYSTVANLLLTVDRRVLRLSEIGVEFGVSVYEKGHNDEIYQFNKNNPTEIENILTFDDFKIMMRN